MKLCYKSNTPHTVLLRAMRSANICNPIRNQIHTHQVACCASVPLECVPAPFESQSVRNRNVQSLYTSAVSNKSPICTSPMKTRSCSQSDTRCTALLLAMRPANKSNKFGNRVNTHRMCGEFVFVLPKEMTSRKMNMKSCYKSNTRYAVLLRAMRSANIGNKIHN
jgi:hypothetical protein